MKDKLVTQILNLISQSLSSEISLGTLFELDIEEVPGWDSLAWAKIVVELESYFDLQFNLESFSNIYTVEAFVNAVVFEYNERECKN